MCVAAKDNGGVTKYCLSHLEKKYLPLEEAKVAKLERITASGQKLTDAEREELNGLLARKEELASQKKRSTAVENRLSYLQKIEVDNAEMDSKQKAAYDDALAKSDAFRRLISQRKEEKAAAEAAEKAAAEARKAAAEDEEDTKALVYGKLAEANLAYFQKQALLAVGEKLKKEKAELSPELQETLDRFQDKHAERTKWQKVLDNFMARFGFERDTDPPLTQNEQTLANELHNNPLYGRIVRAAIAESGEKVSEKSWSQAEETVKRYHALQEPADKYKDYVAATKIQKALKDDERQWAILNNPKATREEVASLTGVYAKYKAYPENYETIKEDANRWSMLNEEYKSKYKAKAERYERLKAAAAAQKEDPNKDRRIQVLKAKQDALKAAYQAAPKQNLIAQTEEGSKQLSMNRVTAQEKAAQQSDLASRKQAIADRFPNLQRESQTAPVASTVKSQPTKRVGLPTAPPSSVKPQPQKASAAPKQNLIAQTEQGSKQLSANRVPTPQDKAAQQSDLAARKQALVDKFPNLQREPVTVAAPQKAAASPVGRPSQAKPAVQPSAPPKPLASQPAPAVAPVAKPAVQETPQPFAFARKEEAPQPKNSGWRKLLGLK